MICALLLPLPPPFFTFLHNEYSDTFLHKDNKACAGGGRVRTAQEASGVRSFGRVGPSRSSYEANLMLILDEVCSVRIEVSSYR